MTDTPSNQDRFTQLAREHGVTPDVIQAAASLLDADQIEATADHLHALLFFHGTKGPYQFPLDKAYLMFLHVAATRLIVRTFTQLSTGRFTPGADYDMLIEIGKLASRFHTPTPQYDLPLTAAASNHSVASDQVDPDAAQDLERERPTSATIPSDDTAPELQPVKGHDITPAAPAPASEREEAVHPTPASPRVITLTAAPESNASPVTERAHVITLPVPTAPVENAQANPVTTAPSEPEPLTPQSHHGALVPADTVLLDPLPLTAVVTDPTFTDAVSLDTLAEEQITPIWVTEERVAFVDEIVAYLETHPTDEALFIAMDASAVYFKYIKDTYDFISENPGNTADLDLEAVKQSEYLVNTLMRELTRVSEADQAHIRPDLDELLSHIGIILGSS